MANLLAEQGILLDQKTRPGLVLTWKIYLLEIAQKEMQTAKILTYAQELFLNIQVKEHSIIKY